MDLRQTTRKKEISEKKNSPQQNDTNIKFWIADPEIVYHADGNCLVLVYGASGPYKDVRKKRENVCGL